MASVDAIIDYLCVSEAGDTESRSFQMMACRNRIRQPEKLLQSQRRSGAWSFATDLGPQNCFHTALALIALRSIAIDNHMPAEVSRAFTWLDSMAGVENHWLWKWKFRYFDRQVRFDTNKTGWPWVEGSVSWVAPTAMVILAHRAWRRDSPRLAIAQTMLLDRACPQGGWNAGNSEVFGVQLDPHPDFTAMALLSLHRRDRTVSPIIAKSLDYLPVRLATTESLYSLTWATLALTAWRHPAAQPVARRLGDQVALTVPSSVPIRTLALVALATETSPFPFFGGLQ